MQRLLERERGKAPDARNRLTAQAAQEMKAGLEAGRWRTGPQVRQWLQREHSIQIAEGTVYKYLGKFAARLKVPRKSHVKKDPLKVEAFKATLADKLVALNIPAGKPVRLWVMDEARFGLHTEHRRVWSLRGVRVVVPHQQKYEWQYVIGALEVGKAGSEFAYVPTMNTQITAEFFKQIARHDPGSVHVVIYDGAGFYPDDQSPLLPVNLRIIKLPPYSPELNPVEGPWDQLRDAIANKVFATIDALDCQWNTFYPRDRREVFLPFAFRPGLTILHEQIRKHENPLNSLGFEIPGLRSRVEQRGLGCRTPEKEKHMGQQPQRGAGLYPRRTIKHGWSRQGG